MEWKVADCGNCPMEAEGRCGHPSTEGLRVARLPYAYDCEDFYRKGDVPELCPLRLGSLTVTLEPMGMGSADRGDGS